MISGAHLLRAQHLSAVMQARGYDVAPAPLAGDRPSADISLTAQIGHRVTVADGETPVIAIDCVLCVNASDLPDQASCWKAVKVFSSSSDPQRVDLAFRIAVTVIGEATPEFVRDQVRRNFGQLWVLIADARDALGELPFVRERGLASNQVGPVAVIEASIIADLLIGRSGVRKSACPSFLASEVAPCALACDRLADVILPDLLHAICAIVEMKPDDLLQAGDRLLFEAIPPGPGERRPPSDLSSS